MGHRTDYWILSVTVARSDHYCFIVCSVESIPVDCHHYFQLLNKFAKLIFCLFLLLFKGNWSFLPYLLVTITGKLGTRLGYNHLIQPVS